MEQKENKRKTITNAGIAGASSHTVDRYSSAIKEHLVSYSGQDNEIGKQLKKGLKDVANERVNPNDVHRNLKQQAGFSAEIKETANVNAERIIQGNPNRKIRTDDFGSVNDPLFDHLEIDASGNIISGSGSQMKFVGNSPKDAFEKLMSNKFSKYLESDAKIDVASDFYDGILNEANEKIVNLRKQISHQKANGNYQQAQQLEKQLQKCQKLEQNLRKSTVSTDEATFARLYPGLSTAKSVAELSHRAGTQGAKYGAAIGGGVSVVSNIVALAKGDVDVEEAAFNVAKDTTVSALTGYGTGFAGSAIKGAMQNSGSQFIRSLAKTNLPGFFVTGVVETTRVLCAFFNGEISGAQVVEQLGEKGIGTIAASYGAVVGAIAIPIPVVGAAIGSMVGYLVSSILYNSCLQILQSAEVARQNYYAIKEMCTAARESMRQQRLLFEQQSQKMLLHRQQVFDASLFVLMDEIDSADTTHFTEALNAIAHEFGQELQFKNFQEFDKFMEDPDSVFVF